MDFPRRTRICLDCRSALCEGEECDGAAVDPGKRHRAVTLDAAGRAALVNEVWGPPSLRRQAKADRARGHGRRHGRRDRQLLRPRMRGL
jgi:hypothetical protein